jgi:hypothetical protein
MKSNLIIIGSIVILAILIVFFVRGKRQDVQPAEREVGISDSAVSDSIVK